MKYYLEYRKASYEIIMLGESKSNINLPEDVEYFVVDIFARYMENPNIPTDIIALRMMDAVNKTGEMRKQCLANIIEECILIDGLELNSRRWPSKSYYHDMGILALQHRAWVSRPPDLFYEVIAHHFDNISKVLHSIKV